ncbi:MAG TPA: hypothetical protein VKC66_29950 [Xanthobacteraceae bacterium]|nr:hypothetical protein [Xanthobacteraceae bacterium]
MHFLIGLAIVLGIIYGMIVSPPFRAAALIVIGTGAMLGALLLWIAVGDPFGWKRAQQVRHLAAIKPEEIVLL